MLNSSLVNEGALSVTTVRSIISNYCVGYSMGCKDYSQFLNGFSSSNKVHKMDISPLECASTRTKNVTRKWVSIIRMTMASRLVEIPGQMGDFHQFRNPCIHARPPYVSTCQCFHLANAG